MENQMKNIDNSGNEIDSSSSNTEDEVKHVPKSVHTNVTVIQEYTSDINSVINELFSEDYEDEDEDEDENKDENDEDYVEKSNVIDMYFSLYHFLLC